MKRCLIYLADPVHNYIPSRDNWMIPLNVLLIAAYTKQKLAEKVEIKLFKLPNLVLEAIKHEPPDILGVSNYLWNSELSKLILRFAKERRADTITVMGGPNIVQTEQSMTMFMPLAACDYYVSGSGEHPFMCLVRAFMESCNNTGLSGNNEVHGIWYLDQTGKAILKPAAYTLEDLDEIPSPFTTGLVDQFFDQGLTPMLESNRGCPYSCTYCVWGVGHNVYKYSVDRIKQDIDYCRIHAHDDLLMLNDANFGLFPDQDLEVARYIRDLYQKYNWPRTVLVNWGQVKSEDALKVADILRDVCILRQSSQSVNREVLRNIKRKNISREQWQAVLNFCEKQGIESFGELILMLPGETFSSYLEGLRFLFALGIKSINTNQLQLLEGAAINTAAERDRYSMVTKWRLLENCYGTYEGQIAIEAEEVVVQTSTFSLEECMECRPLNWLIQMSWTLRRHDILIKLVQSYGVNPVDFFLKAVRQHNAAPAKVRELFYSFIKDAQAELYDSRDELVNAFSKGDNIAKLKSGYFKKLNTYYSSKSLEIDEEFINYYIELAVEALSNIDDIKPDWLEQVEQCGVYLRERNITIDEMIKIETGENIDKVIRFSYDILAWSNSFNSQSGLLTPAHKEYRFFISDQQREDIKRHMKNFSGMSREYQLRKIHEPFFGIKKDNLLFSVVEIC